MASPIEEELRKGSRDELNICEWPITLISDRVPDGLKTLRFSDTITDWGTNKEICRELIITGSDAHGLPTALDNDVIVGLLQLSKDDDFKNPQVFFNGIDLIQLMGWSFSGKSYRRLEESLNRWLGVTLHYKNAWRDHSSKSWVSENFHILDRVSWVDRHGRRPKGGMTSSFTWGSVIFKSFTSGYLKSLDATTYFRLQSNVARRIYRYADKYFYRKDTLSLSLELFAVQKIGLKQGYAPSKIKQLLEPAFAELISIGFLDGPPVFEKVERSWKITLRKRAVSPLSPSGTCPRATLPPPSSQAAIRLEELGVATTTILELLEKFPEEAILEQIRSFDLIQKKRPGKISNPAAYLVTAIREGYPVKKGRGDLDTAKGSSDNKTVSEKPQDNDEAQRYWESLNPTEQAKLQEEALGNAGSEQLDSLATCTHRKLRSAIIKSIVETHIKTLIG